MLSDKRIGRKLVWLLNIICTLIAFFSIITAYLASIGSPLTGYLYLLFKPTCHQLAQRSIFLWGHQMPVCARCAGVWFSLMIFGYIATIILYIKTFRPLSLKLFLISLLPLALDGLSQLTGLRESTNTIRLITGAIVGISIIWFTYPRLWIVDSGK